MSPDPHLFELLVRLVGELIELHVKEKDVNKILSRILESGAEVAALTPYQVSLESFFINAVKEEAAES